MLYKTSLFYYTGSSNTRGAIAVADKVVGAASKVVGL